MKNPFHYIQQYPKRTKQLLGISHEQFQQLLVQAEACYNQQQAEREKNKVRLNAKGGGCKPKLSLGEEVCLCLFYLRQLPTFEVLGLQCEHIENRGERYISLLVKTVARNPASKSSRTSGT